VEVQEQYGDQVRFVGVPGLAAEPAIREFIGKNGVGSFPHLADSDGDVWDRFSVHSQHTYVFINDDGTFRQSGYGQLETDVQELIAS